MPHADGFGVGEFQKQFAIHMRFNPMSMKTWIKRTFAFSALAAVAVAAEAPQAQAGTVTGNVVVSVNVQAACTVTALPLTFPTFTAGSATPGTATAVETIDCPGSTAGAPTAVTVGFVAGATGATYTMLDAGGDTLAYLLCQANDVACATPYLPTTSAIAVSVTADNQVVPLFGVIAAGTTPTIVAGAGTGAFTQTVVFTANF
jgi:spore coat protein U-like protein